MTSAADLNARTAEPLGFHDYARSVCGPGVTLMLAEPVCGHWQISHCPLGRIVVQSGATGGATIADGVSQSGSFAFLLRNCEYAPMSLNGEAVAINDIAVFPPGKQFAVTCRGPHKWISLSVPLEVLEEVGFSTTQLHTLGAAVSRIRVPHWAAAQLVAAATQAMDLVQSTPISADASRFRDIERTLLADLFAAVIRNNDPVATSSFQMRSLDSFAHRALAFIRAHGGEDWHVEHLCQATDMAERSLLRAFHKLFGVGTTQYLKLRRLNQVHCALMESEGGNTTVAGILAIYGVREFGRFAGAYKTLFGESPSETLKRAGASVRSSN